MVLETCIIYFLNTVPCGCRQLAATLLPYADKVAAICRQGCCHMSATLLATANN